MNACVSCAAQFIGNKRRMVCKVCERRDVSIAAITAPFAKALGSDAEYRATWKARQRITALLLGIAQHATDAEADLAFRTLAPERDEQGAAEPLRRLHAAMLELFGPQGT